MNFNDLPAWQKRGIGLYWETYQKESHDPRTGQTVQCDRRRIKRDLQLPMKDEYGAFIDRLVRTAAT